MRDPVQEFMEFNRPFAARSPELLRYKVRRMARGPFSFFRGTFHLFARDVLAGAGQALSLLGGGGPELDLVGDIHGENFGTFKADDGLVHYDINDFDETTRGRFDFDACRLATSWFLAARDRADGAAPLSLEEAVRVALAGLRAYSEALPRLLTKGKGPEPDVTEARPAGCAPIDDLVRKAAGGKRAKFIEGLTETRDGRRRLRRSEKYFNLPDDEGQQALRLLVDYRTRQGLTEKDSYFAAEDACGRVS